MYPTQLYIVSRLNAHLNLHLAWFFIHLTAHGLEAAHRRPVETNAGSGLGMLPPDLLGFWAKLAGRGVALSTSPIYHSLALV